MMTIPPPPQPVQKHIFTQTTSIALFAAVGIAAYLVCRHALHVPLTQCRWLLIAVLAVGGGRLMLGLTRKALAGEFRSDLLAGMSIVTCAVLGDTSPVPSSC